MKLITALLTSIKANTSLYLVGGLAVLSLGAGAWMVSSLVSGGDADPASSEQTVAQSADATAANGGGAPGQPGTDETQTTTSASSAAPTASTPSTTSKPATSTTPKATTPAPSIPAPAPSTPSTTCTNPLFSTSSTNGGWSNGGYYVHNNMWNVGGYSVSETLYACSYKNWYVTATADNSSGDGAVKTYPNVHKNYSGRTIASFSSLTSSFATTAPNVGIYNVAYDMWINGIPNDEIMIWTDNYNQYPGGSKVGSNISLSGYTWDLYATGGNGYIAFVPSGGVRIKSGTLDLKAMLNYLVSTGRRSASDTVDQIGYGIEIVSTGGSPAIFNVTNFSLSE